MKKNNIKMVAAMLVVVMAIAMTACGNNNNSSSGSPSVSTPSSSAPETSAPETSTPADNDDNAGSLTQKYVKAIEDARDAEMNDAYGVLINDRESVIADMMADDETLTSETAGELFDNQSQLILSLIGILPEDAEAYALSISPMNVKAYGIAIVKPAEGKQEVVETGLNGFLETQRKNFETYLPDQYEIAKAGTVNTLDDGTVVMVVSENSDAIYDSIVKSLNA